MQRSMGRLSCCTLLLSLFLSTAPQSGAADLKLETLVEHALGHSPEIRASRARLAASDHRIPQARSLPDPMVMVGYQNEGFDRITYNELPDSQWMFSASQMFPFPGKLALKGEVAMRERESGLASFELSRLRTIARVKELYYDLWFLYKSIDLIEDRRALFSRVEEMALARYGSGAGMQQEVLMAQTERYMLREREEMLRQKIRAVESMLNAAAGKSDNGGLGRPEERPLTPFTASLEAVLAAAREQSPEIRVREKMVFSSEARVRMAEREYYPDITVTGGYTARGSEFDDMWSLTTTINLPIFYRTKQREGFLEAVEMMTEAQSERDSALVMVNAAISDNYSMIQAADRLMDLYKHILIPRITQEFEASLSSYGTGSGEAGLMISRLKSLIELEQAFWSQVAEREKAIARIESIAGTAKPPAAEDGK